MAIALQAKCSCNYAKANFHNDFEISTTENQRVERFSFYNFILMRFSL